MNAEPGNAPVRGAHKGHWRKIAGLALAVIGFFWLAKRAGWLPTEHGHMALLLPMAAIAVGLMLFLGRDRRTDRHPE